MARAKVKTVERPRPQPSSLVQGLVKPGLGHASTHPRKEGHGLPLRRQDDVSAVGGGGRFGIDMSLAPIPQRRYAAELCSIVFQKNEAKIIFAQPKLGIDELDSALVIRMSPVAVIQLSQTLNDLESPTVKEICEMVNISAEELSEFKSHPSQIANVVANICSIAIAGHETCLDFYHASAFAAKKSESNDELEVEPIVRVDLRTSLLVPLIDRITEISDQIVSQHNRSTP